MPPRGKKLDESSVFASPSLMVFSREWRLTALPTYIDVRTRTAQQGRWVVQFCSHLSLCRVLQCETFLNKSILSCTVYHSDLICLINKSLSLLKSSYMATDSILCLKGQNSHSATEEKIAHSCLLQYILYGGIWERLLIISSDTFCSNQVW